MRVLHVGNKVDGPGGIAAVIRHHLNRWPDSSRDLKTLSSYEPGAPLLRAIVVYMRCAKGLALVSRKRETIVHVHISQGGSLVREGSLSLLARALGFRRVVVSVHGSSVLDAGPGAKLAYWVALAAANQVHVLSSLHANMLRLSRRRIVIIPNDVFRPVCVPEMQARGPSVIFLGHISRRKGVDILLDAWDRIDAAGWQLNLYGEVSDPKVFADMPSLTNYYRGYITPEDIPGTLQSSSIFVLPSRAEAFSIALCEALANGCSVITSNAGAASQILESATPGQLLAKLDSEELAQLLLQQIGNPEERQGNLERNRQVSLKYGSHVVSRMWEDLYSSP